MTDPLQPLPDTPEVAPAARAGATTMLVRSVGWLFISAGAFLLLYLVWLLWITGFETGAAQEDLLGEFEGFGQADTSGDLLAGASDDDPTLGDGDATLLDGTGIAVMEFERPGSDESIVRDKPVVIVEGTSVGALQRGPGHYVNTAMPGQDGNFVVAGHRTTYGAPFYNLEEIAPGDLIHVTMKNGDRFTYSVLDDSSGGAAAGQHIIRPTETWVLDRDPVGVGGPMLTLTTCHPRFSATYRLIVFAELVS